MSSNVYKSGFIQLTAENTRVIDGDALAKKHIEAHSGVFRELADTLAPGDDQIPDGTAEDVDISGLTEDIPEAAGEAAGADISMSLDTSDVRAECDEMIREANEKAGEILDQAKAEAVSIREQAKQDGYMEGLSKGTDEGRASLEEAKREFETQKAALIEQYNASLSRLEPDMVAVITGIYEHVFGSEFYNRSDVILCLLNKALMQVDRETEVTVYVSAPDYEDVVSGREKMLEKVTLDREPVIREREDLTPGQAKIETPYGIMDCGIDTELKELNRVLRMLSFKGN